MALRNNRYLIALSVLILCLSCGEHLTEDILAQDRYQSRTRNTPAYIGASSFRSSNNNSCEPNYCPECKSTNVGKYFYGFYDPRSQPPEIVDSVKRGLLIPGGCVAGKDRYKCHDCGHTWR